MTASPALGLMAATPSNAKRNSELLKAMPSRTRRNILSVFGMIGF